jgi:septum formation protein
VIGADTAVILDSEILGKPADPDDATQMLTRLRGRSHDVLTGVATVDRNRNRLQRSVVRTVVTMRDYTDAEIADYIATGEPFDKAGGYGIQGKASQLIAGFQGCYTNVVGLPLCEVSAHLAALGVAVRAAPSVCRLPSGEACPRLGQPPQLLVSEPTFEPHP